MLKYFSLTSIWTTLLVVIFSLGTTRLIETDPIDDFSYSLSGVPRLDAYRVISREKVAQILKERLDYVPQSQISKLSQHIFILCERYQFDPAFILSLIEVESRFRVKIVSPMGAIGLMQVMLPTASYVVREVGIASTGLEYFSVEALRNRKLTAQMLSDPFLNTTVGIAYLNWLRSYYKGSSPYYILGAYNMGPARLDELLTQKTFRGIETVRYNHNIRRGMLGFRYSAPAKISVTSKRSGLRL